MTRENITPLQQLKSNEEHYRKSAIAFHADSVRFLAKADEATVQAEYYAKAIKVLEENL